MGQVGPPTVPPGSMDIVSVWPDSTYGCPKRHLLCWSSWHARCIYRSAKGTVRDEEVPMENLWLYEYDDKGKTPLSRVTEAGNNALTTAVLVRQADDAAERWEASARPHGTVAVEEIADADLSERDESGETFLHRVVRSGDYEAIEAALEQGADPNVADFFGITALHWAAFTGRCDIAELLIERGAELNLREYFAGGNTPYGIARLMGYRELAEKLSVHGGTS